MKEYKRSQRIFGCKVGIYFCSIFRVLILLAILFPSQVVWAKYNWYPAKTWIWQLGANYFLSTHNLLWTDRQNFAEHLKIYQSQFKIANYYQFNNHFAAMIDAKLKYLVSESDLVNVATFDADKVSLSLIARPFYGNYFFYPTFFAEGVLNICCTSKSLNSANKVLFSAATNELALGSAFGHIFPNWTTYIDGAFRMRQALGYSNTFESRVVITWRPSRFIGAIGMSSFVESSFLVANKYPGLQENFSSFYSIEKNKFAWAGKLSLSLPLGAGLGMSFWYAQNIIGAGVTQMQGGGVDLFLFSSLGSTESATRTRFAVE